jgi:hypothetical protein
MRFAQQVPGMTVWKSAVMRMWMYWQLTITNMQQFFSRQLGSCLWYYNSLGDCVVLVSSHFNMASVKTMKSCVMICIALCTAAAETDRMCCEACGDETTYERHKRFQYRTVTLTDDDRRPDPSSPSRKYSCLDERHSLYVKSSMGCATRGRKSLEFSLNAGKQFWHKIWEQIWPQIILCQVSWINRM